MSSRLSKRDQCDIAIIGGGPAGSLSAIHLARAGFKVVLFEEAPEGSVKVCGEFLSYEAIPLLREVGFDPVAFGGREITEFQLHGPKQSCAVRFPRRAVSISRSILDEELLRLAREAGAEIRRGVRVSELLEGLDEHSDSILLSTSHGETRASRLIVATGKTDFGPLNERVGRDQSYVGFKMHVRLKPSCAAKLRGRSELFTYEGGYGGLTDLSDGIANFCFLVEQSYLSRTGTTWDSLTAYIGSQNWSASHILDGAEPLAKAFATVSHVPYGFLRRAHAPAGLFFVGDQMAVIPSMTGEGLSIALMTARCAVDCLVETVAGEPRLRFAPNASRMYQREARTRLRTQIDSAMTVHALFKNARLTDVATYALRAFPSIFDRVFRTTRCRLIDLNQTRRLLSDPGPQSRPDSLAINESNRNSLSNSLT